jgi:hypothetical protein
VILVAHATEVNGVAAIAHATEVNGVAAIAGTHHCCCVGCGVLKGLSGFMQAARPP